MFDIKGYYEAKTLGDFYSLVKDHPTPRIIAGGTDVIVKARERNEDFVGATLIGVTRIPELQGVRMEQDGTLSIGAAATFTTVEKDPLVQKHLSVLGRAVATVGGPQTRNVGTIGGNVCNGATSGDSGATLYVYNAELELHSENGTRRVPIAQFYTGPGKVDLKEGEILTRILVKKEDYEGFIGSYTKFAQRKAMDIANLSCVTIFKEENGTITDLRIAYGVAGPTPIRAVTGEAFGIGKEINEENLAAIGTKCLEDTKARDSWRASKEFREHLIALLPGRNIQSAQKEMA